jgi:hypothetical protein
MVPLVPQFPSAQTFPARPVIRCNSSSFTEGLETSDFPWALNQ